MWDWLSNLSGGIGDWIQGLFAGEGPSLPAQANIPWSGPSGGSGLSDMAWGFGEGAKTVGSGVKPAASALGDVAKAVLPVAQIGSGVMGIVAGQQAGKELSKQSEQVRRATTAQLDAAQQARGIAPEVGSRIATPTAAFGAEKLAKAAAGEIPTASQGMIDEWKRGAKQRARDYLARIGQGESSSLVSWENWIDQQATAMADQSLRGEEALGLEAMRTAGGAYGTEG